MCRICVEYEKGKLTSREALANIGELIDSESDENKQHLMDLANRVIGTEVPFEEWDSDILVGVLNELDLGYMPDED